MRADHSVRLAQGRAKHPSDQVIEALARVYTLHDDGLAHLREPARPAARPRRRSRQHAAPGTRSARAVALPGSMAAGADLTPVDAQPNR